MYTDKLIQVLFWIALFFQIHNFNLSDTIQFKRADTVCVKPIRQVLYNRFFLNHSEKYEFNNIYK